MTRTRFLKLALTSIAAVAWRRLRGRPIVASWPIQFECVWEIARRNMEYCHGAPIDQIRRSQNALAPDPSRELSRTETSLGGVDCEWFRVDASAEGAPAAGTPAVVYLHGGGYFFGSTDMYADLIGRLVHRAGVPVLGVDYRRSPEHGIEEAVEDVVSVFEVLYEQGWESDDLAIAGDSAGGGLTLSSTMAMRDRDLPLPSALAVVSPWVDLRCDADSIEANRDTDYLTADGLRWAVDALILDDLSPDDPVASPVRGDLSGLPPTLVHAGGAEILLDDSRRLAEKLDAAGVDVELEIWPEMAHVFHNFSPMLPRADEALDELAAYLAGAVNPRA